MLRDNRILRNNHLCSLNNAYEFYKQFNKKKKKLHIHLNPLVSKLSYLNLADQPSPPTRNKTVPAIFLLDHYSYSILSTTKNTILLTLMSK